MATAILHTQPSGGSPAGQEALEAAFAFSSLEIEVALFFQGDGVWQLLSGQCTEINGFKTHSKSYASLSFYDITAIYACEESLKQRNVTEANLIIPVTSLSFDAFSEKLNQYQQILRF